YDLTTKAHVHGSVTWSTHQFDVKVEGDQRVITSNDLPDHPTGIFPAAAGDEARRYDPAPGKISAQKIQLQIPANPTLATNPSCVPGAVGILLSGGSLYDALDAPGRDAVAHEMQDGCGGHVNQGGYHYHSLSPCITDDPGPDNHSALLGYSVDGFGIFGRYG